MSKRKNIPGIEGLENIVLKNGMTTPYAEISAYTPAPETVINTFLADSSSADNPQILMPGTGGLMQKYARKPTRPRHRF